MPRPNDLSGFLVALHQDGTLTTAGELPVAACGFTCPDRQHIEEGGIHGLILDKDFATTSRIYLYYSVFASMDQETGEGVFRLSTFVLDENSTLHLDSEEVLLENPALWMWCCHYGGDLQWMADGTLLLSTGDDTSPREDGYNPRDLRPGGEAFNAERTAGNLLNREGPVISAEQRGALIRQIVDDMIGLGVLEPLLADTSVTEIMVNGHDDIWVERGGRLTRQDDLRFASEQQLYQTIDRIVGGVNRRVDESSPMVDARLPSGERVNVIIPPLSLKGPALTIRRFPTAFTMAQLVSLGSLDDDLAAMLAGFVRAKLNLVVSGGTGTGKTTFLNALSSFIPGDERIVTVEDAKELQLRQDHVLSLEVVLPDGGIVQLPDVPKHAAGPEVTSTSAEPSEFTLKTSSPVRFAICAIAWVLNRLVPCTATRKLLKVIPAPAITSS
jgi:hypothetical protein